MRVPPRFAWVLFTGLAAGLLPASVAPAQDDSCARMRGVKSWEVSFTADLDHIGLGHQPGLIRFRASGAGTLLPRDPPGWVWEGTGTYSVLWASTVSRVLRDDIEWVSRAVGGGTVPPISGTSSEHTAPWWLQLNNDCEWELWITNLVAPHRADGHNTGGDTFEDRYDENDYSIWVREQRPPERGQLIQRQMPLTMRPTSTTSADLQVNGGPWVPSSNSVSGEIGLGDFIFTLSPEPEELELIVDAPDYENWTPSAHHDVDKPGNRLALRARLQQRGGGRPNEKASQLRFELVQTSAEPGVALNHPPSERAGVEPDLRFEPERNQTASVTVSEDGLRAETVVSDHAFSEAVAEISSFDWGAWGELRVSALMGDGRVILGHLPGDPRTQILLPKRRPESRIPDALRASAGLGELPDEDDGESEPEADGFAGDGLTLYEEYRGFYENGKHVRGDPKRKDLFVLDEIRGRSKLGIARFARETGLRVRHELLREELGEHRVINVNHMEGPHRVDQHGLVLSVRATGGPAGRIVSALGRPGTPRSIERVIVDPRIGATNPDLPRLVAHELSHAVNVWHHGGADAGWVIWTPATRDGRWVILEGGREIELRAEDGEELRIDVPELEVWVAAPHGQHSGSNECFMRYSNASAYRVSGNPALRYWTGGAGEPSGARLCTDGSGTGVNAADRSPRPRHHEASACSGGCAHQPRVNDLGEAPTRFPCQEDASPANGWPAP